MKVYAKRIIEEWPPAGSLTWNNQPAVDAPNSGNDAPSGRTPSAPARW